MIAKKIRLVLLSVGLVFCLMVSLAFVGCSENADNVKYDAKEPVILTQPQNVTAYKNASTYDLSVVAYCDDNGSLSYQWYSSTGENAEGAAISGAKKSVLSIDTSVIGDSYYYCVVTNENIYATGEQKATKKSSTVKVKIFTEAEAPRITTQPQTVKYLVGSGIKALPLEVVVKAVNGELSYKWFVNDTESYESAVEITGATESSYTPEIATAGKKYYFCKITNTDLSSGTAETLSVTSNIALVEVGFDYDSFTFETISSTECSITAYSGASVAPIIPNTDKNGVAVVSIGAGVFANKKIIEVTIPDTVTSLGMYTNNLTSWGSGDATGVFYNCTGLKTINFNGQLKQVGDHTFNGCTALTTNMFAYCAKVERIGVGSFQKVNFLPETIEIPSTVKQLMKGSFMTVSNVKKIVFSEGLTDIAPAAFKTNVGLEEIVLPTTLITLGGDAFTACSKLSKITFKGETLPTSVAVNSFTDISANVKVYVPSTKIEEYKTLLGANFADKIEAIV